jgi:hypothetical protein
MPMFNFDGRPVRMNRRQAAALVSQHFFQVAPRSLEKWPLTERFINRRVMLETRELVAEAERRLAAAGPAPDRRRSAKQSATASVVAAE